MKKVSPTISVTNEPCPGANRTGLNRLVIATFAACLLWAVPSQAQDGDEYPLRPAVECTPRAGLPNFIAKLEAGKGVKIAYLGGSITAAGGWRVKSRAWFAEKYPDASIEEIHAAIGGTGSDLGVFRVQQDALSHKPDLLFVEFAVNDGGAPPERIHRAMEGIVRQTWAADPHTDICFVYTLTDKMLEDLQSGKMPRAASAMEALADFYHIPSIHFGVKVAAMEKAGELIFKAPKPDEIATAKPMVFSSDGVHPHVETGHQVYTDTIARSWPAIGEASGEPAAHELGKPMREDNWEDAKLVPITQDMLSGEWEKLGADHNIAKRFATRLPEMFQAKAPGATLSFSFKGTAAGVFDLVGPDGGQLEVKIDDQEPVTRNRIDGYCTYHRLSKLNLISDDEAGSHKITVTLTPETLDKKSILFEKNRADLEKNPDKFAPHTWYAGSLMLIGDLE